jgi:hypothetical protein
MRLQCSQYWLGVEPRVEARNSMNVESRNSMNVTSQRSPCKLKWLVAGRGTSDLQSKPSKTMGPFVKRNLGRPMSIAPRLTKFSTCPGCFAPKGILCSPYYLVRTRMSEVSNFSQA